MFKNFLCFYEVCILTTILKASLQLFDILVSKVEIVC
jgi:hypothetical protein